MTQSLPERERSLYPVYCLVGEEVLNVAELVVDHKGEHTHLGGTSLVKLNSTLGHLGLGIEGVPAEVKGTVTEVDARVATIDLGDGVIGTLRASELARGRVEDARTMIKVGDEVGGQHPWKPKCWERAASRSLAEHLYACWRALIRGHPRTSLNLRLVVIETFCPFKTRERRTMSI